MTTLVSSFSPSNLTRFFSLLTAHLKRHLVLYCLIPISWHMFQDNYILGFNQTPSLPQSLFMVHKHRPVAKGDYVAFRVPPGGIMNPKSILTKIVVGVEGDRVTVNDRVVHVNGTPVGFAKTHSLKGEPLDPIREVVVGKDQFYVMGLHKDSLDSRYTLIGLVTPQYIVGKATPIW